MLALSVKRHTKVLIALGVLLAVGGIVAWQWDSILRAYIFHSVRTVTTSLPHCDHVEVFHFHGSGFTRDPADRPTSGFPVRPYGTLSPILNTRTLTGSDAEALAALWRSQTFDPGLQAMCHSAAYGFRFYSGDRLAFETSLCFHCSNFYVPTFNGSSWWGFDSESPKAAELLRRLQEIFPDSKPKSK